MYLFYILKIEMKKYFYFRVLLSQFVVNVCLFIDPQSLYTITYNNFHINSVNNKGQNNFTCNIRNYT